MLADLDLPDSWEIEVAAILTNIGAATLPLNVLNKINRCQPMDSDEQAMLDRLPEVAVRLLAGIPRFEGIRKIIRTMPDWRCDDALLAVKLIKIAEDFEADEAYGFARETTLAAFAGREEQYGAIAVKALLTCMRSRASRQVSMRTVAIAELSTDMVLAAEIRTEDNELVAGKGQRVTHSVLDRIANFRGYVDFISDVVAVFEDEAV